MTKSSCEKKNPCDINYQQKTLLKVLNCLYKQYVVGHLLHTKTFLANPTPNDYPDMQSELYLIQNAIQKNLPASLSCSSGDSYPPLARLVAITAGGDAACDTKYNTTKVDTTTTPSEDPNSFANILNGQIDDYNFANLQATQILNTRPDEQLAYQVSPAPNQTITNVTGTGIPSDPYVYVYEVDTDSERIWITEASVTQRSGCPVIINTGFVRFSIEVDSSCFPFTSPIIPCV